MSGYLHLDKKTRCHTVSIGCASREENKLFAIWATQRHACPSPHRLISSNGQHTLQKVKSTDNPEECDLKYPCVNSNYSFDTMGHSSDCSTRRRKYGIVVSAKSECTKIVDNNNGGYRIETEESKSQSRTDTVTSDEEDLDLCVARYTSSSVGSRPTRSNTATSTPNATVAQDVAKISINYDHAKNILTLTLHATDIILKTEKRCKKVFCEIALHPGKIQSQSTKALALTREIIWDQDIRFKDLTMKQLETGMIRFKFYTSKFSLSKTCIAKTCVDMNTCDYRVAHMKKITLEVE